MTRRVAGIAPNELLLYERTRRKLTQEDVAEQLGLIEKDGPKQVGRWERGVVKPSSYSLRKLEKLYGRSASQLGYPSDTEIPFQSLANHSRNPFFTGRDDVLQKLHSFLNSLEHNVAQQPQALIGMPGVGKTQIAVEYAYRYMHEYHTVAFIHAENPEVLASEFAALATLLDLPVQQEQDQTEMIKTVKAWLGNPEMTRWLLIFDNFTSADDEERLPQFLPPKYYGHIILTSRMQATGTIAQKIEVPAMEPPEGATLLLLRAKLKEKDNIKDIAAYPEYNQALALSEALGGLPLALDQAGAYVEETGQNLIEYLHIYQSRRLQLLNIRGGFKTDYPLSVAATFSLAFEKVQDANPAAIELLYLFAFLAPDAIPQEVITEGGIVLGSTLEALAADPIVLDLAIGVLRRYSLVQRSSETKTYTLHRLVQAILQDGMDDETKQTWAERAVCAIYNVFPNPVSRDAWLSCQRYLPHAQTCISSIKQLDMMSLSEASALVHRMNTYIARKFFHFNSELGASLFRMILEDTGVSAEEMMAFLTKLSVVLADVGCPTDPHQVTLHWVKAMVETGLRGISPLNLLAGGLALLGIINVQDDKLSEAEKAFEAALSIYEKRENPNREGLLICTGYLGIVYFYQGRIKDVLPLFRRVVEIGAELIGDDPETIQEFQNVTMMLSVVEKSWEQERATLNIDKNIMLVVNTLLLTWLEGFLEYDKAIDPTKLSKQDTIANDLKQKVGDNTEQPVEVELRETKDPQREAQMPLSLQQEQMAQHLLSSCYRGELNIFTESAKRVLVLAREEAQLFQHYYIATEHLLLGLIRDDESLAVKVLTNLGAKLEEIRSGVAFAMGVIGREENNIQREISLTPRAKVVIEFAVEEACRLNRHHIGTEHLLLGLVREGEGIAAGALKYFGINLEKVRTQIFQMLNQENWSDMLTEAALKVLRFAHEEAQLFQHNSITPEHLLLGLIRETESVAARVLANCGIELNKARSTVAFIIGREKNSVEREIDLTAHAKKVIELAFDEARLLNHYSIGPEHILLGLVREGESTTTSVLEILGANPEQVRTQVIRKFFIFI